MMVLKPGQVLRLRLPFGQLDEVSKIYHPYLIIGINQHGVKILENGQRKWSSMGCAARSQNTD